MNKEKHFSEKQAFLLMAMGAIFASILVAANAAGAKLIQVGPLAASATVFAYAVSFPITDTVSEVYGKKAANKIVIIGFMAVVIAVIFYQIALHSPGASFFSDQEAFEKVFSLSGRILLGGLLAYLVSQFLDVWVFHKIKSITGEKFLWLRNNGSTAISQLVDTVIFITVAFAGVVSNLPELILGQYVIKLVIAFIDTPIVYAAVKIIKKIDK